MSDRAYPRKKEIDRAIQSAKDAGLEIGGFDVFPDGRVRILTKGEAHADEFSDWKQRREKASA